MELDAAALDDARDNLRTVRRPGKRKAATLESRAKAEARLVIDVPAGWASPSSRGLVGAAGNRGPGPSLNSRAGVRASVQAKVEGRVCVLRGDATRPPLRTASVDVLLCAPTISPNTALLTRCLQTQIKWSGLVGKAGGSQPVQYRTRTRELELLSSARSSKTRANGGFGRLTERLTEMSNVGATSRSARCTAPWTATGRCTRRRWIRSRCTPRLTV